MKTRRAEASRRARGRFVVASASTAVLAGCLLIDPFSPLEDEPTTVGDAPSTEDRPATSDAGTDVCIGIDTTRDPNHCGSCGRRCATGFSCNEGHCGNDVVLVGAGAAHSCAATRRGDVYCWGDGRRGQTAHGDASTAVVLPTLVPSDEKAASVTAMAFALGREHSCALRADGTMVCWGSQGFGALSDNVTSPDGTPLARAAPKSAIQSLVAVRGEPTFAYATIGGGPAANHGCAADRDGGAVLCWGSDGSNRLGPVDPPANPALVATACDGTADGCRALPAVVRSLQGVVQVAAGGASTCVLDGAGKVSCWGSNRYGQYGIGERYAFCPLHCSQVPGSPEVCLRYCDDAGPPPYTANVGPSRFIASGDGASCAVLQNGSVWCWGVNDASVLGHPHLDPDSGTSCCASDLGCYAYCNPSPKRVEGIDDAVTVGVGFEHACALRNTGTVVCWGANDKGQLGAASTDPTPSARPRPVAGLKDVAGIAVGGNHTCAWRRDGTVACWGLNLNGQLGVGTTNAAAPVDVTTLPR